MAIVLGEEVDPPAFRAAPLDPDLLAELAGDYRFGPDFYAPNRLYTMSAEEGHLLADGDWLMPVPGATDPEAGEYAFQHRIYSSDLVFRRDPSGRFTTVDWDGFLGHRVAPEDD